MGRSPRARATVRREQTAARPLIRLHTTRILAFGLEAPGPALQPPGLLVASWVLLSFAVWRLGDSGEAQTPDRADGGLARPVAQLAVGLAVVTVGVMAAIWGVVNLAGAAGVPVFLVSFFGASVGTSLPELLFSITALRRGHAEMAVGDALGASMVDATLSTGIGPLIAPTLVSTALVERAVTVAVLVAALVVGLLFVRRRHTVGTAVVLLLLHLGVYVVLLA